MRTYLSAIMIVFACFCSSCESWLDLKPEDQAIEKDIFSTSDGYRSVLNGLYKNMADKSLYGQHLSFGFLDCLSQQYDLSEANTTNVMMQSAGDFKYDNNYVSRVIQSIWQSAYNVVANANNLIQTISDRDSSLFRHGKMEKELIMGEAYACRALMHFDLLRLFAPAPANDDKVRYIPYVEKYPDIHAAGITVNECLERVIADLLHARALVQTFDTTELAINAMCSGDGRFRNEFAWWTPLDYEPELLEDFLKGRGYRLNYYSMTALLARVYQYAGMHEEAGACAREVLGYTYELSEWDRYVFFEFNDYGISQGNGQSTSAFESRRDLRLVDNLIFAVYHAHAYEELELYNYFRKDLGGNSPYYCVIDYKRQKVFETADGIDESASDIRCSRLIWLASNSYPVSGKWFPHNDESLRQNNLTILPVIRATEMQYIAAESYAREGNWSEAVRMLNQVRREHGCYTPVVMASWEEFAEQLMIEARREWISEGQLFYLYKRLNLPVHFKDGSKRPFSRMEAVIPMPDNQVL